MIYSTLDARYRRIVSAWGDKWGAESRRAVKDALGWS
jgi:hypothetical protein